MAFNEYRQAWQSCLRSTFTSTLANTERESSSSNLLPYGVRISPHQHLNWKGNGGSVLCLLVKLHACPLAGSSGGSAASLATRVAPFALCEDTGGNTLRHHSWHKCLCTVLPNFGEGKSSSSNSILALLHQMLLRLSFLQMQAPAEHHHMSTASLESGSYQGHCVEYPITSSLRRLICTMSSWACYIQQASIGHAGPST